MNRAELLENIERVSAEIRVNSEAMRAVVMAVFEAERDHADVKASLEAEKNELIARGVDGKNQAERDANLKLALQDGYDALAVRELRLKEAQNDLRFLEIDKSSLSERVRLLQAAARLMEVRE